MAMMNCCSSSAVGTLLMRSGKLTSSTTCCCFPHFQTSSSSYLSLTTLKNNFSSSSSSKSNNSFGGSGRPRNHGLKLSHYEILGIQKDASTEDIRSAFIKLSKNYHPDLNHSIESSSSPSDSTKSKSKTNHDKFVEINEAYSVLSKPLARREYDNGRMSTRFNNNNSRRHSSTAEGNYYHHRPFHERQAYGTYADPQFYANRDQSQDPYYRNKPYYGVSGISKASNGTIVYLCVAVLVVGSAFHFFIAKTMSDITIESLNARDKRSHEAWTNANNPNFRAEQLEKIKAQIAENEKQAILKQQK